jgi:hypothetical protein
MTTAIATAEKFSTREEWLVAAIEALGKTVFADAGVELPPVRVSVGWPGGRGKKENVIGQCWPTGLAADKKAQLFISPVLNDGARVLDVLAHELVHAADDCKNGHKAPFAKIAKAIGLTGKMTATVATPELVEKLNAIVLELGVYPHAELAKSGGSHEPKKQGTRQIKVSCPVESGYIVRMTRKWIEELGTPICPCCEQRMVAELPAEDPEADPDGE